MPLADPCNLLCEGYAIVQTLYNSYRVKCLRCFAYVIWCCIKCKDFLKLQVTFLNWRKKNKILTFDAVRNVSKDLLLNVNDCICRSMELTSVLNKNLPSHMKADD